MPAARRTRRKTRRPRRTGEPCCAADVFASSMDATTGANTGPDRDARRPPTLRRVFARRGLLLGGVRFRKRREFCRAGSKESRTPEPTRPCDANGAGHDRDACEAATPAAETTAQRSGASECRSRRSSPGAIQSPERVARHDANVRRDVARKEDGRPLGRRRLARFRHQMPQVPRRDVDPIRRGSDCRIGPDSRSGSML